MKNTHKKDNSPETNSESVSGEQAKEETISTVHKLLSGLSGTKAYAEGKVASFFSENTSSTIDKLISGLPGTNAHAEKKVASLFSGNTFDHDDLTTSEASLLQESIDEKYIPALKEGAKSRYQGLAIGVIAPYEFLLIGVVLLSASANSTTGAWYSITLKEMKEKFEGMGMSLTSRLLGSDISANALSTYAGIGFAYKTLIFNNLLSFLGNPSLHGFIQLIGGIGVTALIHLKLESILARKEDASIQFDFNDATLAGMTEEQQKFFSRSINEVTQNLERLSREKSDTEISRVIYSTITSLVDLIVVFDTDGKQKTQFQEIYQKLSQFENDYTGELEKYFTIPHEIFGSITSICDFSEALKNQFTSYGTILTMKGVDETKRKDAVIAALHDIVPSITREVEEEGEKIISQ